MVSCIPAGRCITLIALGTRLKPEWLPEPLSAPEPHEKQAMRGADDIVHDPAESMLPRDRCGLADVLVHEAAFGHVADPPPHHRPVDGWNAQGALHDRGPKVQNHRPADADKRRRVVSVPGPDWVEPVAQVLTRIGHWGITFRRKGGKTSETALTGSDETANVLGHGHNALGVSQEPARYLPTSLVATADIRIDVQARAHRSDRELGQRA